MGKIFHFAFVVMVTTAIATGILASLNFATQGRIKEMDLKTQMEARKSALPEAVKFDEKKSIKCGNSSFIPGYNQNGEITGYVSTVKAQGYGANGIVFVLGVSKDAKIKGLKITDVTTETPGLGTNVLREEWQKHWAGKDESYEFDKSKDGFAGATISPKGVYTGIKATLKDFKSISVSQK